MRKNLLFVIIVSLAILLFINFVFAETSYCCEKTKKGAWCQNAPQDSCDSNYRNVPTSCESTSYCKLGTCVDGDEGVCMKNTPQKVCEEEGGLWYGKDIDNVPQCNLGCCILGNQASFVTKTRCKKLSSLYGLETNFREDITNEFQCISSTMSEVKGACIFEKEYERTCLFLTKKECAEIYGTNGTAFYEGKLCSDEKLDTNCGPSKKTTCVEGKDEVYFVDTCGNIANIYDSSKIKDKEYWSEVKSKSESCGYGDSNAGSPSCGNCDYYLGSTCKDYNRNEDKDKPSYGDYICRDLGCTFEGKRYEHGETWCANSKGIEDNLPGSRYFRLVCYNGEVSVEPCADYRQEICIESDINGFKTAACRVNRWQDCLSQKNQKDCENEDKRDCLWKGSFKIGDVSGVCIPRYSPGLDFWGDSDSGEICSQANARCEVVYKKKLGGSKKCESGCECLLDSWEKQMNEICTSLGDCGSSTNYLGIKGYHDEKALYSGTSSK